MINNKEKPINNPIYVVHSDLDSFFLLNVEYPDEEKTSLVLITEIKKEENIKYTHKQIEEWNNKTVHEKSDNLKAEVSEEEEKRQHLLTMNFGEVASKEVIGTGVWIISFEVGKTNICSYKLDFECTNNVVEYEALLLGLQVLKKS